MSDRVDDAVEWAIRTSDMPSAMRVLLDDCPRDDGRARDEAGKLHACSLTIEALLQRHLGDEEELAVPIILHHRLRG